MQYNIRQATIQDICRLSEIEIFNYRMNFFTIFKNDSYYFGELQVVSMMDMYKNNDNLIKNTYVYDDGVIKGFIRINGEQIEKLFVEPILHGQAIGESLLKYAINNLNASFLWALEKNERAIKFYIRNGFHLTNEKILEEGTTNYLVKLIY